MGVSAASLLGRLLQHTGCHRKTPKNPKNLPAGSQIPSILGHLDHGNLQKAVSVLAASPTPFPPSIYQRLFQLCSSKLAIVETRKVESHLVTFCPSPSTFLLNRTIEAYAKCGSLSDARELFDEMPRRDGGTWNAMISAYAQAGSSMEALYLFSEMNASGVTANEITFASALGSCANLLALFLARQIHGLVVKLGFSCNVILGSSLVDVYGKCCLIEDARKMFDEIPIPNAVSWNVIVRRYLEAGREEEAIIMFFYMITEHVIPLNYTFSNALISCSNIMALEEGRQIHSIVVKIGFERDDIVATSLVEIYAKCGSLEDARQGFDQFRSKDVVCWTSIISGYATRGRTFEAEKLFHEMPERNVVSWNAMLAGYVKFSRWDKALNFILWMLRESKEIDQITLGLILNVCAGLLNLEYGKQVHGFVYRQGYCLNHFVNNLLLDMYGKCGSLRNAELLFFKMISCRDTASWNALITSYARYGRSEDASSVFIEMQRETSPDEFTFSTLLAACANIFTLEHGKQIHGHMIRNGYEMDIVIRGALVDMYSKCRTVGYAFKVFEQGISRDLILWNSMILGCAYNGKGEYALELFEVMQKEGFMPDNVSFFGVLLACIHEGFVDLGRQYFSSMSDKYGVLVRIEHYECMIEIFGKHGLMDELESFIKEMPFDPTVLMWTRIFDFCREHGNSRLGEWAARCINESNPLNRVQFEVLSEVARSTMEPSIPI